MEVLRENTAKYVIIVVLSVLLAFGIDHYLLGDEMNAFLGLVIGIGPTLLMMLRDVLFEAK